MTGAQKRLETIAPGVDILSGFPRYAINVYIVGDVLIDAHVRLSRRWLLPYARRRNLSAHALTHAHPDHQGASHAICQALGLPLWCGSADAVAMERGEIAVQLPPKLGNRLLNAVASGPAHPVARRLRAGDSVADFEVVETPGHTLGHISFWRPSDRVLILGDVLANEHPLTRRRGLREPFEFFSVDPALNRQSIRAVAALRPKLVCFGHGPPLRNTGQLEAFAEALR